MLTKTIGLTVKNYRLSMTSPLKFFEDDDLELYFKVEEFGVDVIDDDESDGIANPIFPESAILFVETPNKIDSIESVNINGNEICFRLTSKYTNRRHIGVGRMQIVLFDGVSRKALPPFEFEIQKVIYDPIVYNGLANERGIALLSEDNMLLESTDEVYGIKISELPYTEEVIGFIPIVQYGETRQISIDTVLGSVSDKVDIALGNIDERINTVLDEEIPILISNNIDQSLNEVVIPTIDTKLDEVLGGSNLSDLIDNKIDNSLDYSNPASPTIIDFKSALDYLLYFDLSITFTCTEKTTLEIGSVVNSVTFNWSYNKNILSQSFNGTGLENDVRTLTYNEPFTTNKDFKITASDERKSFSKVISFGFRYGRYWGVSSKETLDTSEDLLAINKELSTGRGKTFTANASDGEYIYYCYPMAWGVGTFSVGGFTGGFELVNNLIFTNEKGHSSTYYIYRSTNHSLGNTVVTVS